MSTGARIAIVDDDDGMREAVADLLRSAGHEPRPFPSAVAFLADPGRRSVDCAILDVRMPGMSGLDLLDALNEQGAAPPVIFLSSRLDGPARARAAAGGARCMLDKPVDDRALLACVNRALAASHGPAAAG